MKMVVEKAAIPLGRNQFRFFVTYATRWSDNDMYGHMNNSVYHFYADSVINKYLIDQGHLDPMCSASIGLCLTNSFHYFQSVAYPDTIVAGLSVKEVRSSSVTYRVGIFPEYEEMCVALGSFVHVFVDHKTRKKTPISPSLREALTKLIVPESHL
jgi:acyl-CoA thioester hydrolase